MIIRFAEYEEEGKTCVVLYCGDFDPAGLLISDQIRQNFADLYGAMEWNPGNLIIDRFGLNYNFIQANNLSWIDNLETSNGKYPLNDPRHHDHEKTYVQDYLRNYGARKCEANAIVVAPDMGRRLCRDAITKYISLDAVTEYRQRTMKAQQEMSGHIRRLISEGYFEEATN